MRILRQNVLNWADDKGLLKEENALYQLAKFSEEFGEWHEAVNKEEKIDAAGDGDVVITILEAQLGLNPHELVAAALQFYDLFKPLSKDAQMSIALGRLAMGILKKNREAQVFGAAGVRVALSGFRASIGLTEQECLEYAWNEIKDRTGKMVGGSFVKSEDLKNA